MTYFWAALSIFCALGFLDRALYWHRLRRTLLASARGERRIAAELRRVNALLFCVFADNLVQMLFS